MSETVTHDMLDALLQAVEQHKERFEEVTVRANRDNGEVWVEGFGNSAVILVQDAARRYELRGAKDEHREFFPWDERHAAYNAAIIARNVVLEADTFYDLPDGPYRYTEICQDTGFEKVMVRALLEAGVVPWREGGPLRINLYLDEDESKRSGHRDRLMARGVPVGEMLAHEILGAVPALRSTCLKGYVTGRMDKIEEMRRVMMD